VRKAYAQHIASYFISLKGFYMILEDIMGKNCNILHMFHVLMSIIVSHKMIYMITSAEWLFCNLACYMTILTFEPKLHALPSYSPTLADQQLLSIHQVCRQKKKNCAYIKLIFSIEGFYFVASEE
jgi:hypothetical protein